MEGLGRQLEQARKARGISLGEAARLTKIRESRLADLEAEDFSNFANLAYAKGFLQIYGKFLNVNVSRYLEAFDTSGHMSVGGYSYLQDNPAPKPTRTPVAPRQATAPPRTSIMPLVIALIVLFAGLWFVRLMLNVQRIAPRQASAGTATPAPAPPLAVTTPVATATPIRRAEPVDSPAAVAPPAAMTATPAVVTSGIVASNTPLPATPAPTEPEVRRAEPVSADELAALGQSVPTTVNRIDIRPLKKTYVQVTVDNQAGPAFERWISPADGTVQFRGRRFSVRVLDREAVQIRKNGKPVADGDADLRIE